LVKNQQGQKGCAIETFQRREVCERITVCSTATASSAAAADFSSYRLALVGKGRVARDPCSADSFARSVIMSSLMPSEK
jgi:hypothetical protein